MIEFYRDRRKFNRDRNCMRAKISQVRFVAIKISMSQKIAQQVTRTGEEKYVVTE